MIEKRWKDKPEYLEALYIYSRNYTHEMPQFNHRADRDLIQSEIELRNAQKGNKIFADIDKFRQAFPISKISMKIANFIEDAYSEIIEELVDRRIKSLSPENRDIIDFFSTTLVDRFTRNNTLQSYERNYPVPNQSFVEVLELYFKGRGKKAYEFLHKIGLIVGANYITMWGARDKFYHHYYDILPVWSRDWIAQNYQRTFVSPKAKPGENKCKICGDELKPDDLITNRFNYNMHLICFNNERKKFDNIKTNDDVETEILRDFLATRCIDLIEDTMTEVNVGKAYKLGHPTIGQKSIDAVGRTRDAVWILEIKQELSGDAGFKAIGQVITYSFLYRKEHPGLVKPLKMGVVCGTAEKELVDVFQENDIEVFFCSSY